MPSGNEHLVRGLRRRLAVGLVVSLALSFVGASLPAARVAAAEADSDPSAPASASASAERAEAVIEAASRYIGLPYRLGSEGPNTFDCSGLVFRSFADAGELAQIGGARMVAAGYRRWFASREMFTTDLAEAQRGDLVMYGGGEHIGIYLGERKVLSAIVTGVTVHPLEGISIAVTGFLKVDWSGERPKSPAAGEDAADGDATDEAETEAPALIEEPPNLGLAAYNTFERFAVGGETVAVNVATGNLVLSHPIASLPIGEGALELDLTYNSQSVVDSGLSPGWRLSTMRRLTEQQNTDVVLTAADGSWHTFTVRRTKGTVTTYDRPATLYATLVRDTSQTPEWTLTYRDESVDWFTTRESEGVLTRSVDPLGNPIDYHYGARSGLLKRASDTAGRHVDFDWRSDDLGPRLVGITEWAPLEDATAAPAGEEPPLRVHRLFYDADGYLIGWADPDDARGRCPRVSEHRTCLGYEAGRVATITNRLSEDVVVDTAIAYDETTTEVLGISGTEYLDAEVLGAIDASFERIAPDRVRVTRAGPSPVTTAYRLVSADDSLARVRRIAQDTGAGMALVQRTVWDDEQPIEPARVKTPQGTVSYRYVAGSMGVISEQLEQLNAVPETTTRAGTSPAE